MPYPFVRQYDAMDCGPACISMITQSFGRYFSLVTIRKKAFITREGVSFLGLKSAAESLGFKALGVKIPFSRLVENAPFPCIVHWKQNHFIVVNKIDKEMVWVSDPALGRLKLPVEDFLKGWVADINSAIPSGMALFLEPTEKLNEIPDDPKPGKGFSFLIPYLKPYTKKIFILISGIVAGSLIQLIFPFLTQTIIDKGINNNDIKLIYLILFGQLALTLGRLLIELSRGWILLHLGTKLNIGIISDFLRKLMSLPIAYFDTKLNGDILQRIDDNNRVGNYLTSSSLAILFSLFNFLVFGVYLGLKSTSILLIFLGGTILYILYIRFFMSQREVLDNVRFRQMAEAGNKLINIVNGMQEIKLAGNEMKNRRDWESVQSDLHLTRAKGLKLSQFQAAGGTLIHEFTNIFITIISATYVINGTLSLGEMLAIQFITGQLNGPVSQAITFMRDTQDARISLERLAEIHAMESEEHEDVMSRSLIPAQNEIRLNNVSFRYEGPGSPWVIKDLSLVIPDGKVTAVVGESGSGKTTLLKLIMGFYKPVEGAISFGDVNLDNIKISALRKSIGVVMQEGYIFPDTIEANITSGFDEPDKERLLNAIMVSNLQSLLESLPSGLKTMVGDGGHGLSQGQKQRILIARVAYKQPAVLLLDEATSSLDATNEKAIVGNLGKFFKGRTVIIVAHRLSTVRNADMIVVLDKGVIAETGTHSDLVNLKGKYYSLIRDQLELGN